MTGRFSHAEMIAMSAGLALAALLSVMSLRELAVPASIALVIGMVGWIAWRDIADFIIPDGPLVCIGLLGAALRLAWSWDGVGPEALSIITDATLCGGALWAVREIYFRLRGVDGVGFGDVKLAAVAGILVGMLGFAWSIFVASGVGLVIALAVMRINPEHRLDRLPFGALLAPVCGAIWLFDMTGLVS
jgi:leader peptidase (prepilin peptidase)/N-methyltransferase